MGEEIEDDVLNKIKVYDSMLRVDDSIQIRDVEVNIIFKISILI